jgi:nitrate/TMAO reductase-like tetraheme cytochrome c subunit
MPAKRIFPLKRLLLPLLIVLSSLVLGWGGKAALASTRAEQMEERGAPGNGSISFPLYSTEKQSAGPWNPNCVMCHQDTDLNGITQDSLQISLTVDVNQLNQSVHGDGSLSCTSCHTAFSGYPHSGTEQVACEDCHEKDLTLVVPLPYENHRAMETELNNSCRNCHVDQFSANSMHTPVAESGEVDPPLCTDCHGAHGVQHPSEPPERVEVVCSRCHTAVSAAFQAGEHQSADPATQICTDCHIAHDVQAGQTEPLPTPVPTPIPATGGDAYLSMWNGACTMCHVYPNLFGETKDLAKVSLTVTNMVYSQSVHAKAGLSCSACHTEITGYPHHETSQVQCSTCHGSADTTAEIVASLPYETPRGMTIHLNEACRTCHPEEYTAASQSTHTSILKEGNFQAPLCVDCHGSHDIQPIDQMRAQSSELCITCHTSEYTSYASSVHGVASIQEDNLDAATCVDCHGAHDVRGPRDVNFHNDSVATCVGCHQDEQMMSKYGVPSNLFNPDVDDFHGLAVSLFTQPAYRTATKTIVCYNCHGIHTIRAADDPLSTVHPDNQLETCQQCHLDASSKFPGTGLGHSRSAGGATPLLTILKPVLWIATIAAMGLMLFYIFLDARKRRKEKRELMRQALAEK